MYRDKTCECQDANGDLSLQKHLSENLISSLLTKRLNLLHEAVQDSNK